MSHIGGIGDPCTTILPKSQVIGLSFTTLSGFISSFAVIFVLLLVSRNYIRNVHHPPPGGEWKLIRTHVDAYLLSLLASDFMQGLGAILNMKWASERRVYCSATCDAQGIIQVIGETGVAMSTTAITIHTFLVIFFRWSPSPKASWIWKVVITFIWVYVILFGIVGFAIHHRPANDNVTVDNFFTPTPYWCWISGHFNDERIAGEYFWLWFAAFLSILLYTLLYFRVRGNITIDPLDWRRVRFQWRRWNANSDDADNNAYFSSSGRGGRGGEAGKDAAKEALSMIWYPVTYTILVLPLSIVRWSTFRPQGHAEPKVPPAVTWVVLFIFGLSGIVNVVLILLTRKNLLLFGQRGVVNPARIAAAATGRLAAYNRGPRGGGAAAAAAAGGAGANGGYGADLEAKQGHDVAAERGDGERKGGLFNLRQVVGAIRHHKDKHTEVGSSEDTSAGNVGRSGGGDDQYQGDTSFAAGKFTTQAFETERSFEWGSERPPFDPNSPTSPNSPVSMSSRQERESAFRRTAPENRALGGLAPVNEHSATPLNGSSGINTPAGIESYDLGAPYDEHAIAAPVPEGMSQDLGAGEYDVDREKEWKSLGAAGDAARGHTAGDHLRVERDAPGADSSTPSNFLDFKDSKSGMSGTSGELSSPSPHPYPPPPLPKVEQRHAHPSAHSSHPPIHAYGGSEDGLGARRGSDTSNKNANTSRPSSAKSRGGSSAHPRPMGDGQKRIDLSDYSIPMKFNPTPARLQPAVSPFEDDDDVTYNKSKNGSSRSLSKFFSKSSDAPPLPVSSKDDTSTPSSKSGAWNSLTAIFSNKHSTSNLSLPNQASELGGNLGCDYPPSNPHTGTRGLPVAGAVHWHEKPMSDYYTGDMGPRKRQSSSVTRSDYDIPKKVGVDNVTHVVAFGRRPSDTPSHAASQDGARSNSDTWSRAGGRTYYLHADEEPYGRRPSTGRSSHSYSSSTFGTQSGKNYTATSDTSLRGPVELVNPFAGGEMKEKERSNEVLYNVRHPSYEIGRAI